MSVTEKKKARLFVESVKDRHTSHWDLDLVSKDELEAIMTTGKHPADNPDLSDDNTENTDA